MIDLNNNTGVGVDIEDINRFNTLIKNEKFLNRIYTKSEIDYCFSKYNPVAHLAARFSAKEAVIKAISAMNIEIPAFNKIEITNINRVPKVTINDNRYKTISIQISMSHCSDKCAAFAIAQICDPN